MDFETKYNTKVPAVKRLMLEACELKEATEEYSAFPLDDNLFEWHFTVRGAEGTEFENGVYHGRILLPNEYPMKPPNIILLTPNGRFEVNKKICLSISGHHPETWIPSWSIRTALLALIAFMPTPGKGTIGSLDYTPEERKILARKSRSWKCQKCGLISNLLGHNTKTVSAAESQLIKSVVFKGEESVTPKEPENAKEPEPNVAPVVSSPQPEEENLLVQDETLQISSLSISDQTCNILIGLIVLFISFLVYRRLFLL